MHVFYSYPAVKKTIQFDFTESSSQQTIVQTPIQHNKTKNRTYQLSSHRLNHVGIWL